MDEHIPTVGSDNEGHMVEDWDDDILLDCDFIDIDDLPF